MRLTVHWHLALNAVFVVGVTVVALSLIDFLLTEHQKTVVEKYLYRVSQSVVDVKMINWLRWWLQTARRANLVKKFLDIIAALGYLVILIGGVIFICVDHTSLDVFLLVLNIVIAIVMMGMIALLWAWTVGVFTKIYNTLGKDALQLLAACDTVFSFVLAYTLIVAAGLIFVAVWFGLVYWWIGSDRWDNGQFPWYLKYANNWVAEFSLVWLLLFIDGALTLVGAGVILIAKLLFGSLQLLVWRIVVYSRGPLAAIILLITAALGVLRLIVVK
jgi:hypothetical protein